MAKQKVRLDVLVHERGMAESRARAQALIMAGDVLVNGEPAKKAGDLLSPDVVISVKRGLRYVGRGGLKLEAALIAFDLGVSGKTCLDIGASTGGFTDCLLQRGAARVYSVDVGVNQLAWKLRQDCRVVSIERHNARFPLPVPELVALAAIDVSFISALAVLPSVPPLLTTDGDIVVLVKPQFEAGRERVGKGGVVRDPAVHQDVLRAVTAGAEALGLRARGQIESPLLGPAGNREFLLWLTRALQ